MRERHGDDVFNIGFTTYSGTVTAASDWDGPAERKDVRPALPGSYEELFHQTGRGNFWLKPGRELAEARLERAIGVIYLPRTERMSHYFHASLAHQFDAVIHYETTRAVEPLERWPIEHTPEAMETYPSAV
jgi:erythromycin esterase-like protein